MHKNYAYIMCKIHGTFFTQNMHQKIMIYYKNIYRLSGFVNCKGCTFKRHFNFYMTYRMTGYF